MELEEKKKIGKSKWKELITESKKDKGIKKDLKTASKHESGKEIRPAKEA